MSQPIKILLDNSFIVQSLGGKKDQLRQITNLATIQKLAVCSCDEAYLELISTISKPNVKKVLNARQRLVGQFVAWYKYNARMFKIQADHILERDPKDSMWLNLIVVSKASYLITEDKDLLELKEFEGCKILKFSEFIKLIS